MNISFRRKTRKRIFDRFDDYFFLERQRTIYLEQNGTQSSKIKFKKLKKKKKENNESYLIRIRNRGETADEEDDDAEQKADQRLAMASSAWQP